MNTTEVNPYIRLARPSILPNGLRLQRRVIFDYELIHIERGSFQLLYNDVEYRVNTGNTLLLCPGIPHSFYLDSGDISQPHIHFDLTATEHSPLIPVSFKDIPAMTPQELQWIAKNVFADDPHQPFLRVSNYKKFLSLFRSIIRDDTQPLEKKGLLIELLSLLIADNFPNLFYDEDHHPVEELIKNYIDAGQGLSMPLDEFAMQFSYSKYYLERRFQAAYGTSIIAYRNEKRMEVARNLLKEHTVSEVAPMVGYPSIFSFSRAYKMHFGVPPLTHRVKNTDEQS